MLSRKQRGFILISGLIALLCGVVAAVPFRAFPGLGNIENILEIDILAKIIAGSVCVLLALYPLIIKYVLINKLRENSKSIIVMTYFPILAYAIGSVINVIFTLSFDFTTVQMYAPLSTKVLSVIVAILAAYLVAAIYWIFSIHKILVKVDKFANVLFDIFIFISVACILLLQWRVNSLYNEIFGNYSEFYLGTPFLFVIYIALLVILYFGFNNLVSLIKKDETLIYYIKGETFNDALLKLELNNAYNDTLDDFEQFFDEHLDEYRKMEIQEVEDFAFNKQTTSANIELVKIDSNKVETFKELEEENLDGVESEELKAINKQKEQVLQEISVRNDKLAEIRNKKADLEKDEEELRNEKTAYEQELAEYNQYRIQFASKPEEVETKKKEKKFTPSFEKMVEYAKSFADREGFKVNENAKGNLLKFYLGKKMFLVMQSTASDYRISFITTPDKFVKYVTSRPGVFVVPKNLSDNNWIKFTNKGKEEAKVVKDLIKQAVQTAEKQIADEKAQKEAAKKEKALAKAKERAAAKAQAK